MRPRHPPCGRFNCPPEGCWHAFCAVDNPDEETRKTRTELITHADGSTTIQSADPNYPDIEQAFKEMKR